MAPFHFMARFTALLIHMAGSFIMATAAVALIYGAWYPAPLDKAVGVSGIVLMMIAVDVILGPLLTFIVYQPEKKSLRFDLTMIVALQLAAFTYGLTTIASGRPVWLVFNVDRFDAVQASEIDTRYTAEANQEFRQPSWTGPKWVASVNPKDIEKRNQLILESVEGGPDLPQRIDLFQPLDSEAAHLRTRAQPLDALREFNSRDDVNAALKVWRQADAWLPLMSRIQPMVVLLNKAKAQPVAIVNLRPWS